MGKNLGVLPVALVGLSLALAVACSSSIDSPGTAATGGTGGTVVTGGAGDPQGEAGTPDIASAGGAAGSIPANSAGMGGAAGKAAAGGASGTAGEAGTGGAAGEAGAGGAAGEAGAGAGNRCDEYPPSGQCLPSDRGYCLAAFRVSQQGGMGPFHAKMYVTRRDNSGAGTFDECSIDSATAPAAGDTWVMSMIDHPGTCTWTQYPSVEGRLFGGDTAHTSTVTSDDLPPNVTRSITFVSVTSMRGMSHPEDIYYLGEAILNGAYDEHVVQKSLPTCN